MSEETKPSDSLHEWVVDTIQYLDSGEAPPCPAYVSPPVGEESPEVWEAYEAYAGHPFPMLVNCLCALAIKSKAFRFQLVGNPEGAIFLLDGYPPLSIPLSYNLMSQLIQAYQDIELIFYSGVGYDIQRTLEQGSLQTEFSLTFLPRPRKVSVGG